MDDDKASRFISSLVKSIQALCNGFVDFSSSIEVIGHIHLNIDRSVKLNYILTEEVSKAPSEGATVFASHSYHSQPPPSVSSKSASDTSNHGHKSRKDKDADPLGLSALPREVPNASKSDGHYHSLLNRESSNSSHSFSGNIGFSESESSKHENNRSSCQFEESASRRRKMGPLSQRTPSPAAKRSRVSDFGPGARTVVKEAGFEVIEIKEEPEEEPAVFFGASAGMASGQDIQTPDFSNVVMESLDRVDQLEKGDLASGDAGDVMSGPQQPVFPVMFHPSDGMPSSSAGPVLGPSDSQPVASTSGAGREVNSMRKGLEKKRIAHHMILFEKLGFEISGYRLRYEDDEMERIVEDIQTVEIDVIYSENETISVQLAPGEEASSLRPGSLTPSKRTKPLLGMLGAGWTRRGRYKNYSESDVMLGVQLILSGKSVKKASDASGVPQSTLTDRMARMNLKKKKKAEDKADPLMMKHIPSFVPKSDENSGDVVSMKPIASAVPSLEIIPKSEKCDDSFSEEEIKTD